jgi:hypothetical protein
MFSDSLNGLLIDSTVLAYVMKTLNERYQYGLNLFLLSIDEGITGYRDDSLEVSHFSLFFSTFAYQPTTTPHDDPPGRP